MNFSDQIPIRVRYGETDQMGVVHHGNYALYLEMGRTEWMRKIGISYNEMEKNGVMLPVISMSLNYKKPAHYDDVIQVKTRLKKTPSVRIEFDYEITNSEGHILATAHTVLVFVDMSSKRPVKCPDYVMELLESFNRAL
ncbi:acyl-CoA thioesterase [Bizionia argentinensis JUB59]|uniref:Acyl-CoA thioesterase n=1 Tax=Bizionia argentinensis JUB59 TaxID=1046627 RepID=G2EGM9_9FLAO|nr:thioesterase family protein [Bizionia argentinensis]EGV42374.1 acyl-CoA thioesterase [Bizionia argentinensis JUB59]